jgi:pilus assembly protein Flp/PilA
MRQFIQRLFRDRDGATAVEYAVMLALILMLCIGGIVLVGNSTRTSWENSSTSIQSAMGS